MHEAQQEGHHRGNLRGLHARPGGRMRAATVGERRRRRSVRGRRRRPAGAEAHARAAGRHRRRRRHHERGHRRELLSRQGIPRQPMGPLGPGCDRIRSRSAHPAERADGAAHAHRVRGEPRRLADPSRFQLVQHLLAGRRQPRLRIVPCRHELAAEAPALRAPGCLERRVGQQDHAAAVPVLPLLRSGLHREAVRVRHAHARRSLRIAHEERLRQPVSGRLHVLPQRHRERCGPGAVGSHEIRSPVGNQRRRERAGRFQDRSREDAGPERRVLVRLDARLLRQHAPRRGRERPRPGDAAKPVRRMDHHR